MKNCEADWIFAIGEYLAGRACAQESQRIEAALRSQPEVLRLYLDLVNLDIGLTQAAQARWMEAMGEASGGAPVVHGPPRSGWKGVAAVGVAGLLTGVLLSASMVWAFSGTRSGGRMEMLPLSNADFEEGGAPEADGVPSASATWGGDYAEFATAQNGVQPFRGMRMLKFLRADNRLTPPDSLPAVAEMWQFVPLSPTAVGSETASRSVEVLARFNGLVTAAEERLAFGVSLHAFAGGVQEGPELWRNHRALALASASKEELADREPATWQTLRTRMVLPGEATVLLLGLRVVRKGGRLVDGVFGSHYADDVQLYFVESASRQSDAP